MSKKNNDCCKSIFDIFTLPPCTQYLGSQNPLVGDNGILYRNLNRLFFFLSYNFTTESSNPYNSCDPSTFTIASNGNLQIDIYCFIIGVYLTEIEKGNIEYNPEDKIHQDDTADNFIKEILSQEPPLNTSLVPSLTYIISNSNAVAALLSTNIDISLRTFYIILVLSRMNGDYGLLLSNNCYVTNDFINQALADIHVFIDY